MRARQVAFDFVDRVRQSTGEPELMSELGRLTREFGFLSFCVNGLPGPGERIEPYVLVNGWPSGWYRHYTDERFADADPVIRLVRQTTMPFAWSDAPFDREREPRSARVMDEARDFQLNDGFAVPIYTTHGFQAIVTFGAASLDLSDEDRAAIHLISIYAHSRAREILIPGEPAERARTPRLSSREIECLKWSSAGKSSWETSRILSLSEHTVEAYMKSAIRKLGAVNKTQAVAEALRQKVIN
jgi:LuxR family quorum sensing-dependent transcriptional regulator